MATDPLRNGDLVEVRTPAEIAATLDERGALEGLPFMPEMAALCGRRFNVDRRSERLCDTINWTGSRRLSNAVVLDEGRCDGSAHGGCQAECRFFWKEVWLRKVGPDTPAAVLPSPDDVAALVARLAPHARESVETGAKTIERFRCQATQLPAATQPLKLADARSYVRELATGNVDAARFVKVMSRAIVKEPMRKLGLVPEVGLPGTRTKSADEPPLNLQPGELVRVRSKEQIAKTLTRDGRNHGLWFDGPEMLPYVGGTYRVRQRVRRFIDERDGHMIELRSDAVTLEGVICSGERSLRRWFCPRAIMPYWRECWLERVDPGTTSSDASDMQRDPAT